MLESILARWGGDISGLSQLRAEAAWADDQARDLRKRAFMISRNLTEDELGKTGMPDFFWGLPDHVQEAWLVTQAAGTLVKDVVSKTSGAVTKPLDTKTEIAKYLSYQKALRAAEKAGGQNTYGGLIAWLEHQDRLGQMDANKGAFLRSVIGDGRYAKIAPVLDVGATRPAPSALTVTDRAATAPIHAAADHADAGDRICRAVYELPTRDRHLRQLGHGP